MKVTKEGITNMKRHVEQLPKEYIGFKVRCYKCKAEFKLEVQDRFRIIQHHNDTCLYVDCAHCGRDTYVGDVE